VTFDHHVASSLAEALELLAEHGEDAYLLAGGTSFALLYQQGLIRPSHVIGLRGVPELRGIDKAADGALRIGAMTTHRQAEHSADVRAQCPALAKTFGHVATVRIRNQATVGGNVIHADPAQDPPPMLMALGAHAVLVSRSGIRRVAFDDLFVDVLTTVIRPDEILREVVIPAPDPAARATYLKFLPRTADDYATVSVAAVAGPGSVRVSLGGAGPVPIRARSVERAIAGGATIAEAAAAVDADIDPITDVRGSASYKRRMARVWTERALQQVLA
jgi:carbon-monoxide dehydrogenase medium subunit